MMKCYAGIKKNKVLCFAIKLMQLETFIVNGINQSKINKCMFPLIVGHKTHNTKDIIYMNKIDILRFDYCL